MVVLNLRLLGLDEARLRAAGLPTEVDCSALPARCQNALIALGWQLAEDGEAAGPELEDDDLTDEELAAKLAAQPYPAEEELGDPLEDIARYKKLYGIEH
jgi:hypothetical protein